MNQHALFDSSATPQLVFDPFGNKVVAGNIECCRWLAMEETELIQCQVSHLFSASFPDLLVFTQELMWKRRGRCDHLLIKTETGPRRVEVNGVFDGEGSQGYISLSFQSVDELNEFRDHSDAHRHYLSGIGSWNQVARIFQEFERENQLLLDAAGEGIYGVDCNGLTTFVNPAALQILGYTDEELAGKNMHSLVHHSHSDGSHFGVQDCPIFAAFREGSTKKVDIDVFWNKSGHPVDVEYTSTPIRDEGFIVGAVVIFRDVSEKRQNERQLRHALEEVEQLKNRLELEKNYLKEEISSEFNHHQIIGRSPALQRVINQIELVAPTDATVLIFGESGTGKELIARAIHDTSTRSERPLIRVNCAAIPESLFESEFFGHVKGAFTGATTDRLGRFELADGGTLFLDEVGEIPLHLQGKLLRVLQEQSYERIGDTKTRKANVRIIAATNRDLVQDVQDGKFREDLYFRLNVFPVESIPLRQRVEDIAMLTQHFLEKASTRANKSGLKVPLGELDKLKAYHWPGNIRELENVVERQVILAREGVVRFDGLVEERATPAGEVSIVSESSILTENDFRDQERKNIIIALKKSAGKVAGQNGAAEMLALKPTTLSSRIKKYKINPRQFK